MKKKDYLKYLRLARYFIKSKYKLKLADLEMLTYLYSEGYFSHQVFHEYKQVMTWEKNKMERFIEEGWVSLFRKKVKGRREIYQLTHKAKHMIANLYNILDGGLISTHRNYNPMFRKDPTFTDKVFRNAIKKRNKSIKQQQHPSRRL